MNLDNYFRDLIEQSDAASIKSVVRIEFDGGTPCNIPSKGYGIGYGSYQISCGGKVHPVQRINHGRPMSANAAEIMTLVKAIQEVSSKYGREGISLKIHGDSQIALKWARGKTESGKPCKLSKNVSMEFRSSIHSLRQVLSGFQSVEATWRGREASVKLFGH